MFPLIHLTCDIACLGTCRNGYIVGNTCLWIYYWIITWLLAWILTCWIIYSFPCLYYVIGCISTILYICRAICLHLYISPIWTRAVFILHSCCSGCNSDGIMSLIYLGHLLMFPLIHLTCDIASLSTCRNSYIVGNTCLWIWSNHWIITWLLAWILFTIHFGISCFTCTRSYFNTSTFTNRDIYSLIYITVPASTILKNDIELRAFFGINIPFAFFSWSHLLTRATSRPYPCCDSICPCCRNFSLNSDVLSLTWSRRVTWIIYRSPFSYHVLS